MYTNIFSIIFANVIAVFLILWAATFFLRGKDNKALRYFLKAMPIIMFVLGFLLIMSLLLQSLLFKNIQIHTYF